MGRFLQIRVTATTFDPAEVERAWPRLWALAWPETGSPAGGRGVLELVAAVSDRVRFGDLDGAARERIADKAARAAALGEAIDKALSDRDAAGADKLSYDLEDALGELDRALR